MKNKFSLKDILNQDDINPTFDDEKEDDAVEGEKN